MIMNSFQRPVPSYNTSLSGKETWLFKTTFLVALIPEFIVWYNYLKQVACEI